MNVRGLPWIQLIIAILLVVFGWWFYTEKLEWQDYTSQQSPSRIVRENPLLASVRLLETYDYRTQEVKDIRFFDDLDAVPNESIWLLEADSLTDAALFQDLAEWTSQGGHLILGLDDPMSERLDVFLEAFDVEAFTDIDDIGRTEQWEFEYIKWLNDLEEDPVFTQSPHSDKPYSRATPLSNNRGSTLLTLKTNSTDGDAISIHYNNDAEVFTKRPVLQGVRWPGTKKEHGVYVNMQIEHGEGIVTVLGDSAMFTNRGLKKHDNSSYLLQLLSSHPSKELHYFITQRTTPTLINTLWAKFPMLISLLGVALLAWVFYAAARLGPVRTETTPGKTNLVSHLRARGHFWRRRASVSPMSEPVRQAAIRSINHRYANQLGQTDSLPDTVVREIAEDIGCSTAQVKRALSSAPLSVRELPNAAFVLQRILHPPAPKSPKANRQTP